MLYCLSLLGIDIPSESQDPERLIKMLEEEFSAIPVNLAGRKVEDLLNASEMEDPNCLISMQLLMGLWTPCYGLGHQLLLPVVSTKVTISPKSRVFRWQIVSFCINTTKFL